MWANINKRLFFFASSSKKDEIQITGYCWIPHGLSGELQPFYLKLSSNVHCIATGTNESKVCKQFHKVG